MTIFDFRSVIHKGFARALWCFTWADYMDNTGQSLAGCKIEDVAPDTPDEYLTEANTRILEIERINGADICTLLDTAWTADEKPKLDDEYASDFGFFLAAHVLGSGMRWTDDHAEFKIEVPYHEEENRYGGPEITKEEFESLLTGQVLAISREHNRSGQLEQCFSRLPELQEQAISEIRARVIEELYSSTLGGIVCLDDVYRTLEEYGGMCVPADGGLPWVKHIATDALQEKLVQRFADKS
jgi:hypothetical protein